MESLRHHIRDLGDDRAIEQSLACAVATLVVNEEEIAQGPMDDIESHIRRPLTRIAIVLNQGVQKHSR